MSTLRVIERVEQPAVLCRKCDRAMVGGTLPARLSLCGGCAVADSRPRVNRYMKRTARRKRLDHFLDSYLPLVLWVSGGVLVAVSLTYTAAKALGWVR